MEGMTVIGPSGCYHKHKSLAKQLFHVLPKRLTTKTCYHIQDFIYVYNAVDGFDIHLLTLPVAHLMLNTSELVWGKIRHYVQENYV